MLPITDATTTPPVARVPVLIGLAAVAVYLLLGVNSAVGILSGSGHPKSDPYWLGRWKMFTDLRPQHAELRASVHLDGVWAPVALAEVFPNSWQEGPGYHRKTFWSHPDRLAALAEHTCQETGAASVRLWAHRWDKTLASAEQPVLNPEERTLLEQPCGRIR
ncbi:MAG: hypothetical protein ACI8RZ_007200 [Myxococcota bacterium]|jgi:hypothetical protein